MSKLGVKTYLENSSYYDFVVTNDSNVIFPNINYLNKSLAIDFSITSGTTGYTLISNSIWDDATVSNFTLNNIEVTGFDNYFINHNVVNSITGATTDETILYEVEKNDRFQFHPVSGYVTDYTYAINHKKDTIVGDYKKLNGGFYQGFFKLFKYPYEVLPKRMKKGWTVNLSLRFPNEKTVSGDTLNDKYESNSGFFFYMGTRAENKFMSNVAQTKEQKESLRTTDINEVGDLPPLQGYSIHYSLYSFAYNRGYRIFPDIPLPLYYPESRGEPQEVEAEQHENYPNHYGFNWYINHNDKKVDTAFHPLNNLEEQNIVITGSTDNVKNVIDNNIGFRIRPDGRIGYRLITTDQCLSSAKKANIKSLLWYRYWGFSENSGLTNDQIINLNNEEYFNKYQTKKFNSSQLTGNTYYAYFAWPKLFGRISKIIQNTTEKEIDFIENEIENFVDNEGETWDYWVYRSKYPYSGTTNIELTVEREYEGYNFSDYLVREMYSDFPIFNEKNDGWIDVSIVFERDLELEPDCVLNWNQYRKGQLVVYVNGRPVLKDKEFFELIPHGLDAVKEVQEGVPFNISWGGGTQGLIEAYPFHDKYEHLLLEKHFSGSWMGGIKDFNFYVKPFSFPEIRKLFYTKKPFFNLTGEFGGRNYKLAANN